MDSTPATPIATSAAPATAGLDSLLLADGLSPDLSPLLAGSRLPLISLHGNAPALERITTELAAHREKHGGSPLVLHLLCHGRPGALHLNGAWITAEHLINAASHLATWQVPRIALWSCQTGLDQNFIALFSELTGAVVYSSARAISAAGNQRIGTASDGFELNELFHTDSINALGWSSHD